MTREQYIANMRPEEYIGKHEKKNYKVWRVLGPAGPAETITVYGLDAVKAAVQGCWDWEVKDMYGNIIRSEQL